LAEVPAAVSPDGRWLLLVSESAVTPKSHVRILDLNDPKGASRPLWKDGSPHEMSQPDWSPDGQWVAMVSSELSTEKNVVVRSVAAPARAWKVSEGGGWQPVWSRDGKQIFYFDFSATRLLSASIDTSGGAPRIGAPKILFRGRFFPSFGSGRIWDIHPEGSRILAVTLPEGQVRSSSVEIVLNWDGTLPA
jgi:hypothetical protein